MEKLINTISILIEILVRNITQIWLVIVELGYKIIMLITFIGMIPVILNIYYYLLRDFNFAKVVASCLVILVITFMNIKIQGGKI